LFFVLLDQPGTTVIPSSRLHEFGFPDAARFPQRLKHHAVSLSLPSAISRGLSPVEVMILDGLVVPSQAGGGASGMIIRSDGAMLFIGHRDAKDPSSALEARFIRDIPYDARLEASNIMRRAVLADPSLAGIWRMVHARWALWFPPVAGDGKVQLAGEFITAAQAWNRLADLLGQLAGQHASRPEASGRVVVKVMVQSDAEFNQGWQGEELEVDVTDLAAIIRRGHVKYLYQDLFPRMQAVLRNPMFLSGSGFRLYYAARHACTLKLVVVSPGGSVGALGAFGSPGIELTLAALDGFSPSFG
jgi:hypothetical protein